MSDSKSRWEISNAPFRKKILASDQSSEITVEINHAEMVIDGKSLSSAYDFVIVGQNDSEQTKIDFEIMNPDDIKTLLKFKIIERFKNYFLYYGNKTQQQTAVKTFTTASKANSTFDIEEKTLVNITISKTWILKENSLKNLQVNLESSINFKESKLYGVINEVKEKEVEVKVTNSIIELDVSTFKIGENSIYLYFTKDSKIYKSNTISFIYTAPVYVAWTMDWEGTAPEQKNIDSLSNLADEYVVPITHFFNPRLYIYLRTTDVRRKEVTDYMVQRINGGDDIALHMHMQHDMVEEAGVKAKYNEKSWDNGVSGYDTPTTAYNYDEMKKIIAWGKKTLEEKFMKFSNYKLPRLQGYRTGGWFANEDTLRAIQDNGFDYDSSGRVAFEIGQNKFKQTWDLFNISQPYTPSIADQNNPSTSNLNLLEVPNNGADSYWSSAKEMAANFYANYSPGDFISSDKLVVYLSHPDWFDIDSPKLRELFKELGKFRNDRDLGPVKFVTIREYLAESGYIKTLNLKVKN